jgi:hypothetical protein
VQPIPEVPEQPRTLGEVDLLEKNLKESLVELQQHRIRLTKEAKVDSKTKSNVKGIGKKKPR